jgi:hypothetical protein
MSQKDFAFCIPSNPQKPDEWDFLHAVTRLHSQGSRDERYAGSSVKLAHPTLQDSGYVQAVEKNTGCNTDCRADARSGVARFC